MELTFASYNIHKAVGLDRKRDPERILRVLREVDADIVALQECDMRFGERESVIPRALIDDTKWRAVDVAKRPRSIGWHGNALLVRRDIDCVEAHPLDLPTLEPRGAAMAELKFGGKRFRVIGTHLDLSGLRRRDQVRALIGHCEGGKACPTVIMGDFNQWGMQSGAMREFGKGWQQVPLGASFPARRPVARLDRIIVTADWKVHGAMAHHSALSAQASDHLPVSVRLTI